MLSEKKSFRRFLLVYISSSLFLLLVGGFMYYKMSYQLILNNSVTQMKKDIDLFIETNRKNYFIKKNAIPNHFDIPIAVYFNKEYKLGNFQIDSINFTKEVFQRNHKLYYIHKEHKKWADIYFITYKDINKDIKLLQQNIVIFLLFSTLFIIIIAIILGKIFLKPMRESLESLENFITDATHEINTPISNILINIELSKELTPLCADTEEFQKIESSAFRISKIFKDLSFVRLEHKEIKKRELLNIQDILEERINFFMSLIKNKKLILKKDIQNLEIEVDKEDLIRLIDNLLSNAIKYTPTAGTLEIKLIKCLEIINDGELLNQQKIMQKFVRDNKSEGGFGLGLYIVQKICDSYGYKFKINTSNKKVFSKICFI